MRSLHRLLEHWLWCYELFDQDKKDLRHVHELRYEDHIRNRTKKHAEIAAFIGTCCFDVPPNELTSAYNQKYFDRWSRLLSNSQFKQYYHYIAKKYERRFATHNYSLLEFTGPDKNLFIVEAPPVVALGVFYFGVAQASAWLRRSSARLRQYVARQVEMYRCGQGFSLPRPVQDKIEYTRGRWRSRTNF